MKSFVKVSFDTFRNLLKDVNCSYSNKKISLLLLSVNHRLKMHPKRSLLSAHDLTSVCLNKPSEHLSSCSFVLLKMCSNQPHTCWLKEKDNMFQIQCFCELKMAGALMIGSILKWQRLRQEVTNTTLNLVACAEKKEKVQQIHDVVVLQFLCPQDLGESCFLLFFVWSFCPTKISHQVSVVC